MHYDPAPPMRRPTEILRGVRSRRTSDRSGDDVRGWPHVVTLEAGTAGLALARRAIRGGGRATAIAVPGYEWEVRSRGLEVISAPFGPDGEPWLAVLERLAASGEQIVVLPATDRGSELLVHAADRLPNNLLMFERRGPDHLALMDKDLAESIARQAGVAVPWTARIRTQDEFAAVRETAPWPCVVKPILSHEWRARYGEKRAFLAADAEEAARLLERPLHDGVGMLLCQYVPGGDDDVEEAIVVRLADGSYPVSFGCRKLRQFPRGFGATALGESSELPETVAIARRVLDESGFVGVAGVEVKRDAETGKRWFLEVNVRMPGQWGLGDAADVAASERLGAALSGRPLGPQRPLRTGVRFVVPDIDLVVWRELLREVPSRQRLALIWSLAGTYRGAREVGLLDPRDPGPGLAWLRWLAGRRARRAVARIKRAVPSRKPAQT
jgi:D-aspartate ligase